MVSLTASPSHLIMPMHDAVPSAVSAAVRMLMMT